MKSSGSIVAPHDACSKARAQASIRDAVQLVPGRLVAQPGVIRSTQDRASP